MSERTKIAWCDSTFNPWRGCTKVSAGCASCYAETWGRRFGVEWWPGKPRQSASEAYWRQPIRWNEKPWVCEDPDHSSELFSDRDAYAVAGHSAAKFHRRRVFSLSLGDWLDPEAPVEWLARLMDTIRQTPNLNWILCTKRPEKWDQRCGSVIELLHDGNGGGMDTPGPLNDMAQSWLDGSPPQNVCVLASVEDQAAADERIPHLLKIPARWRGLSMEPLLGEVSLYQTGGMLVRGLRGLHWLVIGGESGPKARLCNTGWIRDLVSQGREAGVAVFVKQIGSRPTWGELERPKPTHPKGGDPSEWPTDLRVREWPEEL